MSGADDGRDGRDAHDAHDEEQLGDLGEEAAKLLGVLAGWTAAVDDHVATGAPECQWCPVCRVVHVVRTSPELRGHLAAAASSLLRAAAMLATPGEPGAEPGRPDPDPPDPARPGPDGADDLEHIDLDDPDEGADGDQRTQGDR